MKKRVLALLLAFVMLVGMLPTVALAADTALTGKAGDNITWTLSDGGKTLTFSGTGAIPDCDDFPIWGVDDDGNECDEQKRFNSVEKLVIDEGITRVGVYAFDGTAFVDTLKEITLPSTLTEIGEVAFMDTTNVSEITIPASVKKMGQSAFDWWTEEQTINVELTKAEVGALEATEDWYDWSGDATVVYKQGGSEQPGCDHGTDKIKTTTYMPAGDGTHTVTVTCECGEVVSTETVACTNKQDTYESNNNGTHTVIVICGDCKQELGRTENVTCVNGESGKCACGYTVPATVEKPKLEALSDTFYPYTAGGTTRYYVKHYEVNETAETLNVLATGQNLKYQWYYRTTEDAAKPGTAVENATNAAFTPDTSAETEMRFYYCVISNEGGSVTSDAQPVIVCENPSETVYFSLTDDDHFVVGDNDGGGTGAVMGYRKYTVPYFDLKAYGLEGFYFKSESYGPADSGDQMGGSALNAGTSAEAYGKVTALHLMIYALEHDYYGVDDEEIGKGFLKDEDCMGTSAINISGSTGSLFFQEYWGHDLNFNYYVDYVYPLASGGWGSTADQILMREGSIFSMMMYTSWAFFMDVAAGYNHFGTEEEPVLVETTATDKAPLELTLYRSYGFGGDYSTSHTPVTDGLDVYYTPYSDEAMTDGDVTGWILCGKTDENGKFVLDTAKLGLTSGKYLFAVAGQKGKDNPDDYVSCPGGIIVDITSDATADPDIWNVTYHNSLNKTKPVIMQRVNRDVCASAPAVAAQKGYTFLGWFTDEACTQAYDFTKPVTARQTLYAGWERTKWTVTFDENYENGSSTKQTVEDGQTAAALAAPTRDGYRFDGWYTNKACTNAYSFTSKVTKNVTLYAKWIKTWTVSFNNNGTVTTETVDDGQTVAAPAEPKRDGYTFTGWFTDEACTSAYDFTAPVKGDLTLHAGWKAVEKNWTVTFVDRLGANTTATVKDGQTVSAPTAPVHAGYTFLGWFTDEACTSAYNFANAVTANLTLYAGWRYNTPVIPVIPSKPAKPSAPSASEPSFSDVSKGSWYYDGVKYVCEKGLMNGTSATTFSPNANTTRGMILTMLTRAEGVSTAGTPWYAAGQRWAMSVGISDGTNMEDAITREQLAAMLYRYAKLKGYDGSKTTDLSGYSDAAQISTYATDAMRWAVANGLIEGSANALTPKATATRAQVATILMRFLKLYTK